MMDTTYPDVPTYTDRHQEEWTVTQVDEDGTLHAGSLAWGGHQSLRHVTQGTVMLVETTRGSTVCGVATEPDPEPGSGVGWQFRKSDQTLRAEWGELRNDIHVRRVRELRKHRSEWQAREDALPKWLQERLQWFHLRGGRDFQEDGWPYELVICELAALYAADEDWVGVASTTPRGILGLTEAEDPEAVSTFCREEGVSGNQVGMAQQLVLAHHAHPDRSMAGTVSALSPITGDPDYGHGQDQPVAGTVEEQLDGAGGYVEVHLQVDDDGNEAVLVHPLSWVQTADPDAVSAYGQSALDALNAAGLLPTDAP